VRNRDDAIEVIKGMALAAAADIARADAVREAVRVEVKDEFDPSEPLKLRVFIGQRATAVSVEGWDVDHVLSNGAVYQRVTQHIKTTLAAVRL
jgi:hypothetical protein